MQNTAPLVDSRFDNLFRQIITAGWNVKSDGEVESPTGFFALVEIPTKYTGEYYEMLLAVEGEPLQLPWNELESGWYVTVENSDGIIFVFKCPGKSFAENLYTATETQYNKWLVGE